jgi:hypothetical protein
MHPEFRACSKEDFLAHITDATSAWAKALSDCHLLPAHLGTPANSATTESEIRKEIDHLQGEPLPVKKRRLPSEEDPGHASPKAAREESPSPPDLSWLGCMQPAGPHEGMLAYSQLLIGPRDPPGGAGTAGGPRQAYPLAPQPRRALPRPSAFAPCSRPRALWCGGGAGAPALRDTPAAVGPARPLGAGPILGTPRHGGPGFWLSDRGEGARDRPPSGLPEAAAHSAPGAAPPRAATAWPGTDLCDGGSELAFLARAPAAAAASPSGLLSLDRPAGAFTAVVRPTARPAAAAPAPQALLGHGPSPLRVAPTPIPPLVAGPRLRGAAPCAWPPGPSQAWPRASVPAAAHFDESASDSEDEETGGPADSDAAATARLYASPGRP